MPKSLPKLPDAFFKGMPNKSFTEISFEVAKALIGDSVPGGALREIVDGAINFPAPVRKVDEDNFVLELFHGPSMAFKDFGARFMSRLMHYFLEEEDKPLHILVATSGDTGGAVALGFYDIPGIEVTILYPKGKVSPLQEKQLTTLGKNIKALEIDGSFDDCQRLVKTAFLDEDLSREMNLSSANSINIARLIPQTFYYFNAYAQLRQKGLDGPITFSVPSGNFGNLTAGLFAKRMGLPTQHFVASTNINDTVPRYLESGIYTPGQSHHTLSNAMDIGDPSNFQRMLDLFEQDLTKIKKEITGYSFTDEETLAVIETVETDYDYMLCPHTAIAYAGLKAYLKEGPGNNTGVFVSSAHPCKFPNVYSKKSWEKVKIPDQAKALEEKEGQAISISNEFSEFKAWLRS